MTAYQITVSNSLRTLGGGPSSLWQAYKWNAFKWGEGTAKLPMRFVHLVSCDPIVADSSRNFRFVHLVSCDPLTMDSSRSYRLARVITNTLVATSDSPNQTVTDSSSGFNRIFPGQTTNANDRVGSTWAEASANSPTWTTQAASSTTWTAA